MDFPFQFGDQFMKDIMVQRYTCKEEMLLHINNTINSFSYYGNDQKSDELELLVNEYLGVKNFAKVDILYFLCLICRGIGTIKLNEMTIDSDYVSTEDDLTLTEYSLLSVSSPNDAETPACSGPSYSRSVIVPQSTIKLENHQEIGKTMKDLCFWNSSKCTEVDYMKHVLLCMIQETPIGDMHFTHSKSSSNYFNSIISNITILRDSINKSSTFLFMRRILEYIDGLILEFRSILIVEFENISSFWECKTLIDAPFNSIIKIKQVVSNWQCLFYSLTTMSHSNPFYIAFTLLSDFSKSNHLVHLADILCDYRNEFAYECCKSQLDLAEFGHLAFFHELNSIYSLNMSSIDKSHVIESIKYCNTIHEQFKIILVLVKRNDTRIKNDEKMRSIAQYNKTVSCLSDPGILDAIHLVCQSFLSQFYFKCRSNTSFLLNPLSIGSVPVDIDSQVIETRILDSAYKMPLVDNSALKYSLEDCKVFTNVEWMDELLECKLQECLIKIARHLVSRSRIYCKKRYMIYLSVMIRRNNENLQEIVSQKMVTNKLKMQGFLLKMISNACSPSDVIRDYEEINIF
eukprot:NODE_565_length_6632_cov_0.218276.p2 type:complete len:573 gc:universal NODE_565_length_6632_cov_0.218276:424-2142(+)